MWCASGTSGVARVTPLSCARRRCAQLVRMGVNVGVRMRLCFLGATHSTLSRQAVNPLSLPVFRTRRWRTAAPPRAPPPISCPPEGLLSAGPWTTALTLRGREALSLGAQRKIRSAPPP